jgi:formylmethanofuran dehydrogenase subunit D
MTNFKLTLITGRSTKQGAGISSGKEHQDYKEATRILDMNPGDMERAGLTDGDTARITTELGSVDVTCRVADIPEGLAFIAFGSACNSLVGDETYASGMPDSKHLEVAIERVLPESHKGLAGIQITEL